MAQSVRNILDTYRNHFIALAKDIVYGAYTATPDEVRMLLRWMEQDLQDENGARELSAADIQFLRKMAKPLPGADKYPNLIQNPTDEELRNAGWSETHGIALWTHRQTFSKFLLDTNAEICSGYEKDDDDDSVDSQRLGQVLEATGVPVRAYTR